MRPTVAIGLLALTLSVHAQDAPTMSAPIVFFDIAGADSDALRAFYSELFGWNVAQNGSFSAPAVSPLPGTIRQDQAETLFYIGVDDVTATLQRVEANDGSVEYPRFEVPGVVILGMFKDPAGNRVGLVEMENGRAKIP